MILAQIITCGRWARWPKSYAVAAKPLYYWRSSMPMRYAIAGSTAMAFMAMKSNCCISPCKCESEAGKMQQQTRELSGLPDSSCCHSMHQEEECLPSTIVMLATSSSSSTAMHPVQQLDAVSNIHSGQSTLRSLSWWKRIGRAFFVVTRGIEIVVRLSPLLSLTPTAMVVSYIDPIIRRRCAQLFLRVHMLTVGGGIDHCHLGAQDTNFLLQHDNNNHTRASNLSWNYTLHTLQCLGPAFVKKKLNGRQLVEIYSQYKCAIDYLNCTIPHGFTIGSTHTKHWWMHLERIINLVGWS